MVTAEQLETLAVELFKAGAVQFGGFKIKHHETNPDAPLSPIFLNLRAERAKNPGPVSEVLLERICYLLSVELHGKGLEYTHVCGVPHAGDPYADRLVKPPFSGAHAKGLIRLSKKTHPDGKREIVGIEEGGFAAGDRVLLVDDLITKADSKLEAIYALEQAGLVVKDVAVAVDRCQGGKQTLEEFGYNTHALYILPEFLGILRRLGHVDHSTVLKVLSYIGWSF